MKAAGYDVRKNELFAGGSMTAPAAVAPIVGRMQAMWETMRVRVLAVFPSPPGLPAFRARFMRFVEEIYQSDAYHSLSIEGYSISADLVERVRAGNWDPDHHDPDRHSRDALAARGYWQAFQIVKANVGEIIAGVTGCSDLSTRIPTATGACALSHEHDACLGRLSVDCAVVRIEDRNAYLAALDRASIDMDIDPFAAFLAERVRWSMNLAA